MAIVYTFSTTATLTGARNLNRIHRVAAQEDLGSKVEKAISALNTLNTAVSLLNTLIISANLSAVGFSAISGAGAGVISAIVSTAATLSNFRA
jgi:hypothetical protein